MHPKSAFLPIYMAGIYIHIPFCESRCIYCGFYSTTLSSMRQAYIDAVCRELDLRTGYLSQPVSTVYLGGGTPSQLSARQLEQLLSYIYNKVEMEPDAEITVECNPDDMTPLLAQTLASLGVNRVSMGAQTFSDERLAFLHRRHRAHQVAEAVGMLRANGIDNISIDLMFGFPGQTIDQWNDDVTKALALKADHISAYSLAYEEGTALYRMLQEGRIEEVDEEVSRDMYYTLVSRLTAAGYGHYEISNFARSGRQSRHNSSYWSGEPYLGLGAAAHSYNKVSRQWNISDVRAYIQHIGNGVVPMEIEHLDADTRYDDMVMTRLRTRQGISLNDVESGFGAARLQYLMDNARRHIANGTLQQVDGCLSLTLAGLYVSDGIMADLMWCE